MTHLCRRMPTRHCPPSFQSGCGDRPCARFESTDETPWITPMLGQVLAVTDGKSAEENPGYRLVLSTQHLEQLASESPWNWPFLALHSDLHSLRVFGYPIRVNDSAVEMRLEAA